MRTISILQPSYLPWLGCLEQIARCDAFVFYDDVAYDRHGWRNRNRIKTSGGAQWLTIPVHASCHKQALPLNAVRICSHEIRWKQKHLNALQANYARSSWFQPHMEQFENILMQSWEWLCDLTIALIQWLCQCFGIHTPLLRSSQLHGNGDRQHRLINLVRELDGDCFYEGAAGHNYIDVALFQQHGVQVLFQDYKHPVYEQQHGVFISHLSAIDALFNCGAEANRFVTIKQ